MECTNAVFSNTVSFCVFLNTVLSIRQNTTYRPTTIVSHYTLLHVSAVRMSHHQEDVGHTKINLKGERPLFTGLSIIIILLKKRKKISLKLTHIHVTEFLRYKLYGIVK